MRINPIKLIKSISQNLVESEDVTNAPKLPALRLPFFKKPTDISFDGQKLAFRGKDLGAAIAEASRGDAPMLSRIAAELEEFRKRQLKRAKQAAKKGKISSDLESQVTTLLALCEAFIARIGNAMKNRYDETQSGLRIMLEDGHIILNGMNVNAYVSSCRDNPTPKSRVFLKGIRNRLWFVLQNRANAHNYDRIRDAVTGLFTEIDGLLSGASIDGAATDPI